MIPSWCLSGGRAQCALPFLCVLVSERCLRRPKRSVGLDQGYNDSGRP